MSIDRGVLIGSKPEHDCLDHLQYKAAEWTETHGLDCGPYERGFEEWWECALCGEKFTAQELDRHLARIYPNESQAGSIP